MRNREDETGESGFSGVGLALALMATAAIIVLFFPSQANPEAHEAGAAYSAPAEAGYQPARVADRGKESRPAMEIHH